MRAALYSSLSSYIRHKSHKSRALDGLRKLALALSGNARALSRHDASVRIYESFENRNVFVIDFRDAVLFKEALICFFCCWNHNFLINPASPAGGLEWNVFRFNVLFGIFNRIEFGLFCRSFLCRRT